MRQATQQFMGLQAAVRRSRSRPSAGVLCCLACPSSHAWNLWMQLLVMSSCVLLGAALRSCSGWSLILNAGRHGLAKRAQMPLHTWGTLSCWQ